MTDVDNMTGSNDNNSNRNNNNSDNLNAFQSLFSSFPLVIFSSSASSSSSSSSSRSFFSRDNSTYVYDDWKNKWESGGSVLPSHSSTSPERSRELYVTTLIGAVLTVFAVVTVLGNGLVIMAVSRERYLRTVTNYFIVSLAVADLLIGVAVMPSSIALELSEGRWIFGSQWCDLWHSFDVLASTASILNLSVISLDRYWAITDPIAYPVRMSTARAAVLVALVWIAASGISFPAIVWWHHVIPVDLPTHPSPISHTEDICVFTDDTGYLIFSSTISFYLPVSIILFAYYRIYVAAAAQTRGLRTGSKLLTATNRGSVFTRCCSRGSPGEGQGRHGGCRCMCAGDSGHDGGSGPSQTAPEVMALRVHRGGYRPAACATNQNHDLAGQGHGRFRRATTFAYDECRADSDSESMNVTAGNGEAFVLRSLGSGGGGGEGREREASGVIGGGDQEGRGCGGVRGGRGVGNHPSADTSSLSSGTVESSALVAGHEGISIGGLLGDTRTPRPQSISPRGPRRSSTTLSRKWATVTLRRKIGKVAKERKAAKTLGVVIGVFCVCWVPFFITNLVYAICHDTCVHHADTLFPVFAWLGYINSGMNPLIYAYSMRDFRRAFVRIVCRACPASYRQLAATRMMTRRGGARGWGGGRGGGGGERDGMTENSSWSMSTNGAV